MPKPGRTCFEWGCVYRSQAWQQKDGGNLRLAIEHIVLWSRAFSSFQHGSSHNAGPPHIFRHPMDRIDKDPISSFRMVLVIFHTCFTSRTCALLGLDFMLRPLRSLTSHCKIFHQQRTCSVAAGCIWSDHVGSCQAVCRQPVPWEDFRGWNDSWDYQLQEKSFVIYDSWLYYNYDNA